MTVEPPAGSGERRPVLVAEVVVDDDGAAVVVVAGEVDPSTADLLARAIAEGRRAAERVVVDVSGVTFMDSAGLEVLIDARRQAREDPAAFVLRSPTPALRQLLEITGLDTHLTVEG